MSARLPQDQSPQVGTVLRRLFGPPGKEVRDYLVGLGGSNGPGSYLSQAQRKGGRG
jgi:hypothetical protein